MSTTIRFAWRNIWRNPRRTILTMLAIGFGAALLVFSIGLQLGQYDLMIANSVKMFHGLVQIQKEGYLDEPKMRTSIPNIVELTERIRQQTKYAAISARANGFALVSSAERTYGTLVVGVDPQHEIGVSTIPGLVKQGHYLEKMDSLEVIIGTSLAKNLQIKIGDDLTMLGSGRDGSVAAGVLRVVGIYDSGSKELDRNMVQIPLQTFQDLFAMEGHGHAIVVYDENIALVDAIQTELQRLVANEEKLVALRWDQVQPGLREVIELDYSSGWFMYIVLVAIIVFSIMNTFLMAVLERTREFGIMLALGFRAFNIGKLVMTEALILTVIALVFGTLVGFAVNAYFYIYGLTFPGMEEIAKMYNMPATIRPQLSFHAISIGPAVILVFTLIAALYPAMRIRKLEPVDAMRKI